MKRRGCQTNVRAEMFGMFQQWVQEQVGMEKLKPGLARGAVVGPELARRGWLKPN